MVNKRRHVQEQHERFNVKLFLKEFNTRYHADFHVIDEPNPPEAIIRSKLTTRWVEVTTAYLNQAYAIDLNTYAVKGEKHQHVDDQVILNVDEEFAKHFVRVVKKKVEKLTYAPFYQQYGKGYLVVSIKHPMFSQKTLAQIDCLWDQSPALDKGFFKSVYIVYPLFDGYKVALWKSNLG